MKKSKRQKAIATTSVVNRRSLENCWILEDGLYTHADEMHVGRLPYVALKDEHILQENQIPYAKAKRIGKDVLEYWNPECDEREQVEAPLYAKIFGRYENMGKTYTGERPTVQMIEKAIAMKEVVSGKQEEYRQEKRRKELYQEAKTALDGGWARYKDVKHRAYFKHHDIQEGDDHIKCFPVVDTKGRYLEGVVFFDVSRNLSDKVVTLKVPEEMSGWIKGKKGQTIKAWAEEIGAKRINLIQ